MMPTTEQISRAIVAAVRECGVWEHFVRNPECLLENPVAGRSVKGDAMRHAKGYAAFALRKAFPGFPTAAIGRAVGSGNPECFLGILIAYRSKGKLPWYDPEVEARVVAAIAADSHEPVQRERDESSDGGGEAQATAERPAGTDDPPARHDSGSLSSEQYRLLTSAAAQPSHLPGPAASELERKEAGPAPGPSETIPPAVGASSLNSEESELAVTPVSASGGSFRDVPALREGRPALSDAARAEGAGRPQSSRVQGLGFSVRPKSKRMLEDELRQAVLNTGGRLAE